MMVGAAGWRISPAFLPFTLENLFCFVSAAAEMDW